MPKILTQDTHRELVIAMASKPTIRCESYVDKGNVISTLSPVLKNTIPEIDWTVAHGHLLKVLQSLQNTDSEIGFMYQIEGDDQVKVFHLDFNKKVLVKERAYKGRDRVKLNVGLVFAIDYMASDFYEFAMDSTKYPYGVTRGGVTPSGKLLRKYILK